jgi:hypothetical protein
LSCVNDSAFVADVTVPDNSIFHPGERIDKTWRVRNSGSCPWDEGYRLVFISGSKLGAPDNQPVVPTAPGGTTDITIIMYAPSAPGTYTGLWRLVSANGEPFGGRFTVVIQIPSPFTPTPVIPPTPTPLPGPIVNLSVEREHISAGECTKLHANVEGVSAAWLDGSAIVGGVGEKQVCPCDDTRYTLDALLGDGRHVTRDVTVKVDGSCVVDKPDLVIREITADPDEPKVEENIHFRMRIKNQGTIKAKNFIITWDPGDSKGTIKKWERKDSLNPGNDYWIEWDYKYSEDRTFNSLGTVDDRNDIDESNEDNNEKEFSIKVRNP